VFKVKNTITKANFARLLPRVLKVVNPFLRSSADGNALFLLQFAFLSNLISSQFQNIESSKRGLKGLR
jgi:hypothetical protein